MGLLLSHALLYLPSPARAPPPQPPRRHSRPHRSNFERVVGDGVEQEQPRRGVEWVVISGVSPSPTFLTTVIPIDSIKCFTQSQAVLLEPTLVFLLVWFALCLALRFTKFDSGRTAWFRICWWPFNSQALLVLHYPQVDIFSKIAADAFSFNGSEGEDVLSHSFSRDENLGVGVFNPNTFLMSSIDQQQKGRKLGQQSSMNVESSKDFQKIDHIARFVELPSLSSSSMFPPLLVVNVQSSLAAARADNFYYPPEWDPKKGSLNKFQGQHPMRERARKLDQCILIIR
ncbi:hypothetical protein Cni_G16409 [Canna indica]|uniref:Uncharacterized protein n=1 Tax=Canna indica TaxID=4628 RepID=A0AAQ3KFA3_9LILI|nr:hypothetical protein Cni_G16409 [Canna indica]